MEMRRNYIERSRYGTKPKKLLAVKELTNQAWKRRLRREGDRSTKLVPPTLDSMIDRQSGYRVGYVGSLHGQAGIMHPILVQTRYNKMYRLQIPSIMPCRISFLAQKQPTRGPTYAA